MEQKARHILEAFTAGKSWRQILTDDRTLTYHDLFHVVSEAPTSFWRKAPAGGLHSGLADAAIPVQTPITRKRD